MNGFNSRTPGCIIHHNFGSATHMLNVHAYFRHTYGVTGCKYEERKHYKIATALRIYKSRTKIKGKIKFSSDQH